MSLNIKNERVCALVRQAADQLGTTQTSVVELALERLIAEHLAEREKAARWARVERTLAEIHALVSDEDRAAVRVLREDMYDEMGLPQ